MGIGKRVKEAIEKMQTADPEAAWIPTSIALDATAKKEYPNVKKVGERYKKFIHENFRLISRLSFGGVTIGRMHLGYQHPDIKIDDKGTCSIEEILYHAVRCGLLHEGNLPKNLRFVRRNIIQRKEGVLILPSSMIYGIIICKYIYSRIAI